MRRWCAIVAILISFGVCESRAQAQSKKQDWAQFYRYAEANATLGAGVRAVFMGDSIFDTWAKFVPEFFETNNFVGRGISGQTTSEMLVRFRRDVIDLRPEVVHILAGTNDIAQNNGEISLENIVGNIASMCDLAEKNGIGVVLATLPPAEAFKWRPEMKPAAAIVQLNEKIRTLATERNIPLADYHGALDTERGGLPECWSSDGVHPNAECFREVMAPLAVKAIGEVPPKREKRKRTINNIGMIYPIVVYGSPVLRKKSENIDASYPDFKKLIEDMFLTLTEASGVGLAAPQIGKNIRLFIVDCTPWGEDDPALVDYKRVFVNAEIYWRSDETGLFEEGCLSIPGIHENVRRPITIRMRYLDENFVEHDEEFTGLPARVIQHEYDHLEGMVFTDHLSALRRNLLKGKMLNMAKGKYRCSYKTK